MSDSRFTSAILEWYAANGRDLPWRRTRNPYAIWLSEIILQQTRIAQGLAYWQRFMERFPDVESLAAAEEDEVLRLWEGLGYYSRGRTLLAAARQVAARGAFPVPGHLHGQLGRRRRGIADVDHIIAHTHERSHHHVTNHQAGDTAIATHYYFLSSDKGGIGRCKLHDIKGIQRVAGLSADRSANARNRFNQCHILNFSFVGNFIKIRYHITRRISVSLRMRHDQTHPRALLII